MEKFNQKFWNIFDKFIIAIPCYKSVHEFFVHNIFVANDENEKLRMKS